MTSDLSAAPIPIERGSSGHVPGEIGVWVFIFALLFVVFLFYRGQSPESFLASQGLLNQHYGAINTMLLLASSWFVVLAVHSARRNGGKGMAALFGLALLCGLCFSVIKFIEYAEKISNGITLATNDFFMYYFVLTGIHFLHVIIGMSVLATMIHRVRKGYSAERDERLIESGASYWHMVDVLWIALFSLLYLVK